MSNSYCCCFGRFVVAATAAFFRLFPRTIYLFLNAITCGSSAAMANEKGGGGCCAAKSGRVEEVEGLVSP